MIAIESLSDDQVFQFRTLAELDGALEWDDLNAWGKAKNWHGEIRCVVLTATPRAASGSCWGRRCWAGIVDPLSFNYKAM